MPQHLLRTLPADEVLAPAALRREGERFWSSVEIPLCLDALFLVRVSRPIGETKATAWLLVAGAARVLDTLERVGMQNVMSLQLVHPQDDEGCGGEMTQLVRLESVHDAANPADMRVRFCTADHSSIILPLPESADQSWVSSGGAVAL